MHIYHIVIGPIRLISWNETPIQWHQIPFFFLNECPSNVMTLGLCLGPKMAVKQSNWKKITNSYWVTTPFSREKQRTQSMTSFQAPDFKTISFKLQKKKKKSIFILRRLNNKTHSVLNPLNITSKKIQLKSILVKKKINPYFNPFPRTPTQQNRAINKKEET